MMEADRPGADMQIAAMLFAVLLIDGNQTVVEANHSAENMFGRSVKRMTGRPLSDLIRFTSPVVQRRLETAEAQLLARGIIAQTALGEDKVNLTISPIPGRDGWKVLTISSTGQNNVGEEADGAASLIAPAILAHEIKNPLAAIRGAGQLLARKLEEKDRPLTSLISGEVDRIARLIDRMQKLGSRQGEPVGPLNLHHSIRNAVATVRAGAKERAVLVEEFDPSLPLVLSNGDALEQVLINLLSNAVDACEGEGSPQVIVKTRFASGLASSIAGTGQSIQLPIEITVSDNGPGITPGMEDHIFDPFVSSKKNGQGLGLALVKKMVSDMGGRITHRRNEAAGMTEFRIHLAVAE